MHKILLSILVFVATAVASPTVFFIRHGEKPKHGGTGLSTDGLERAQCVRDIFGPHSDYNIGYILAQRPKSNGKRARPYDTVKRLATDLGLDVDIYCDRDDAWCVKKTIREYKGDGNILICWEHHRMTHLVEELGNDDAPDYPDDRFDLIWTDPHPYKEITKITSERCSGLDHIGYEDKASSRSELRF